MSRHMIREPNSKYFDFSETFHGISRGRNARYRAPPAQTRTCGFPASGSSVVLAFATGVPLCKYHMLALLLSDPG